MGGVSFQVTPATGSGWWVATELGKTTLTKVLSGTLDPSEGAVEVTGELGYLPQDTHSGEDTEPVLARILSARSGRDPEEPRRAEEEMGTCPSARPGARRR